MEFQPDAPDAPQAPPSDGADGVTNDPRPLGGRESTQERSEKGPGEEEGQPTNDPRPLGGASVLPAVEQRQEQAKLTSAWKDPVQGAEGAVADAPDVAAGAGRLALVSSASGAAADVLRTTRDKASTAASAAASAASGALEAGKAALSGNGDEGEAPTRHVDEVDLSPEEQFTRHRVELDPEKLHHWAPPHEGRVARAKHTAENVVHKVEHLLTGDEGHVQRGASEGAPITLQALKFKEPMHMAKAAEGRNVMDEKGRLLAHGTSATAGGTGNGEGGIQFPETLQQAIQGISEEPEATPAAQREEEDEVSKKSGGDPQEGFEPEPFGVTSGARSKL